MRRNLQQVLIPARFMLTLGHLISVLMIIMTKRENITAALPQNPTEAQIDDAKDEVLFPRARTAPPPLTHARPAYSVVRGGVHSYPGLSCARFVGNTLGHFSFLPEG